MAGTRDPTTNFNPSDEDFDSLVEEIVRKMQCGDSAAISEFAAKYPQHTHRLNRLLPSLKP